MKLRLTFAVIIVLMGSVGAVHELSAVVARQIEPVTLHLTSDGPLDVFDPLDAVQHEETISQLYLGLTSFDPSAGTIQPALASGWEVSADGLVWRFTLRDDVPWVRWNPVLNQAETLRMVAASDVVYGIEHVCIVEGCEVGLHARALDDTSLEITLPAPDPMFLNLTPYLRAMPQDVIEQLGEAWSVPGNLVTNGPFGLDEWIVGVRRVYLRNPLLPQDLRGPGNVQRVVVDILAQEQFTAASLELFEKSLLDITRSGGDWLAQPWITGVLESFDSVRYDWITIDQAAQLIARKSWSYPTPEPLP